MKAKSISKLFYNYFYLLAANRMHLYLYKKGTIKSPKKVVELRSFRYINLIKLFFLLINLETILITKIFNFILQILFIKIFRILMITIKKMCVKF